MPRNLILLAAWVLICMVLLNQESLPVEGLFQEYLIYQEPLGVGMVPSFYVRVWIISRGTPHATVRLERTLMPS